MIKFSRGYILIQALVFGAVGVLLIGALTGWAKVNILGSRQMVLRERAFQIAEAGIEYYRWHLAHAAQDYQDGTGVAGPYIHEYYDKDGDQIGTFTLTITPPPVGSTVVTILSQGNVLENPAITRKIEARLAIPSIAKYAFVANSAMRFGAGTEVFGPIHSNDGIRFDGLAHNVVTSARSDYDDPDHTGSNEFGVHTHVNPVDPVPPALPPVRNDVFMAGRQFPVPAVNFTGFTNDMSAIRADALRADGTCWPDPANGKLCFPDIGYLGYRVVLRNDDTFELHRINSLNNPPSGCNQPTSGGVPTQPGWGTWSISTQSRLRQNLTTGGTEVFPFPANGIVFFEEHVWVEGTINTARLTIASGKFPENATTNTSITVNNDVRYTNYDGQDVLALIAQNNFNVGLTSEDDLRIDAAIVAKNGRAGRHLYTSSCGGDYIQNVITLFGMLGTNLRYGFAYINGFGTHTSGYITRNITYDANLLYGPPPSFPLTSDQYSTISWREVP